LKEILRRRLAHSEWPLGAVLVADGGRAQLRVLEKICAELGVKAKIVAVVKDEYHRAREIIGDREVKKIYEAEILLANAEAHRYALAYHRQRRDAGV
jgi:excinuclease UvrABC nuclease subunit